MSLKTGEISGWSGKGQHTTTFAEMFDLPGGGRLIDTPGMREFGLVDIEKQELSHYFPEMRDRLNNDSADKAARFILNCNQKKIPLVFLQDVTGFMVGSRSEHAGIIKDGAKMVNAVANSVVPKITIIVGNSYGAGNYAMCGKAYDPRFIYAWPTAKIAVMGGDAAAKVLLQIEVASLKAKGQVITPENEKKLLDEIKGRYDKQTSPYSCSSH